MLDLLVVGGGAAGFYGAIHTVRQCPGARVLILEQNKQFLSKVRISGGGRCNVTHRPMEPDQLARHYPRGERELLGPFHRHASQDTMMFFQELGVPLKIEVDGRVFPQSNSSESIIEALITEATALGIKIQTGCKVTHFSPIDTQNSGWNIETGAHQYHARNLLICPGSSQAMWKQLAVLGLQMVSPVPSLFTFRILDPRLTGLQGVSAAAQISVLGMPVASKKGKGAQKLTATGPVLITHWGLSGPAVLRLSAWGARHFADCEYRFEVVVNWLPEYSSDEVSTRLTKIRNQESKKLVSASRAIDLPVRLWKQLVTAAAIGQEVQWAQLTAVQLNELCVQLTGSVFKVTGKSTFKEEFVTAGGVSLKEINFKTFESKKHHGLFLAGEVLDIDAITGGFNFQNAWTGSFLAATGIVQNLIHQESPR